MSREAMELIAQCTALAMDAVRLAESIADRHNLEFDFDVSYGMGGTYYSEGYIKEQGIRYLGAGWNSSSSSC